MTRRVLRALPLALAMSALAVRVYAQDESPSNAEIAYAIDNMMLFIAAVLVFFMQAGFALVEAGFNSAKNALNIMFKNFIDVNVGIIIYWLFGYGVMYGAAVIPGWLAWNGWGVDPTPPTPGAGVLNTQVDWLFQVAFAATAATIVSGAVAGRIKFSAYLVYTIFISAIVYPISGYWKWGGGWLNELGFHDFAGSLVVHAVGGFAGLAGAILLGPRIGRFSKGGNTLPPHNYTLATLGVFILWIGWYGFNPGSQLAIVGAANTDITMMIAVNTTLAAAAGAVVALLLSRFLVYSKWDLGLALNGMLAGLVGITANCDAVTNSESMIIGAIAAGLMTGAVVLLERWKIDDPVGAFPVHGVCGVWAG
ncbi:MAG TPA: ammonium transporter, partial [Caldilineaceae bacterium]|nr:ammonium transporter [Caldilineaceae bacterium]